MPLVTPAMLVRFKDFWRRPPRFHSVVLIAFAVRIPFLVLYDFIFSWYWHRVKFDYGWEMGQIALNFFEGRGFSSPFSPGSQPTAWVCPLVPLIWTGIMEITGEATGQTAFLISMVQALASSVAAGLYCVIFKRVVPHARPGQVWLFTVLVVLWLENIYILIYLWYYVWQELSVAALVLAGILWADRQTVRNAILLGVSGGVAMLINVNPLLLFVAALAVPVVLRRSLAVCGRAGLAVAISATLLSPWIIRNIVTFRQFVPLRGNAGVELLQGNNPQGSVRQVTTSVHPGISHVELAKYQELGEFEYNRQALHRAVDWMIHHPVQTAIRIAQRIYVSWFTDITDEWSSKGTKWWRGSKQTLIVQFMTILSAIVPLILAVVSLGRAGISAVPYPHLLLGVPLIIPLPHYFTQIEDTYMTFVRLWLMMIVFVCYLNDARKCPSE